MCARTHQSRAKQSRSDSQSVGFESRIEFTHRNWLPSLTLTCERASAHTTAPHRYETVFSAFSKEKNIFNVRITKKETTHKHIRSDSIRFEGIHQYFSFLCFKRWERGMWFSCWNALTKRNRTNFMAFLCSIDWWCVLISMNSTNLLVFFLNSVGKFQEKINGPNALYCDSNFLNDS